MDTDNLQLLEMAVILTMFIFFLWSVCDLIDSHIQKKERIARINEAIKDVKNRYKQ